MVGRRYDKALFSGILAGYDLRVESVKKCHAWDGYTESIGLNHCPSEGDESPSYIHNDGAHVGRDATSGWGGISFDSCGISAMAWPWWFFFFWGDFVDIYVNPRITLVLLSIEMVMLLDISFELDVPWL